MEEVIFQIDSQFIIDQYMHINNNNFYNKTMTNISLNSGSNNNFSNSNTQKKWSS